MLSPFEGLEQDGDEAESVQALADQGDNESIDEVFKNLSWTRVISLSDYKELSTHVYPMADDIKYVKQKMAKIKLEGLP